jgi:hypothetical protein
MTQKNEIFRDLIYRPGQRPKTEYKYAPWLTANVATCQDLDMPILLCTIVVVGKTVK